MRNSSSNTPVWQRIGQTPRNHWFPRAPLGIIYRHFHILCLLSTSKRNPLIFESSLIRSVGSTWFLYTVHPWSLSDHLWNGTTPKGKDPLPTIIFKGLWFSRKGLWFSRKGLWFPWKGVWFPWIFASQRMECLKLIASSKFAEKRVGAWDISWKYLLQLPSCRHTKTGKWA